MPSNDTMPDKIHPDFRPNSLILKEFREYLIQLTSDPKLEKAAWDAIKLVDCLRFIRINEDFIRYAFTHKDNEKIYTFPTDKAKGVLRDFNHTSFHLNGYQSLDECIKDLRNFVSLFEKAIELCSAKDKLVDFVKAIEYEELVGCLDARISPALVFAKKLETRVMPDFMELMMKVYVTFTGLDGDEISDYQKAFEFFQPFFGEDLIKESKEVHLSKEYLIDYMSSVLNYPKLSIEAIEADAPRTAQKAFQLISDLNAAGKTLSFAPKSDKDFKFIIEQLLDPASTRPFKTLGNQANRKRRYNPRTKLWEDNNQAELKRGRSKQTDSTKKEAVSLMPSPPLMNFYHHKVTDAIGLLFNVNLLNMKKGKYVWKFNVRTNDRWWIAGNQGTNNLIPSVSMDELRKYLKEEAQKGKTFDWTEQLFGLKKEALVAVFAHRNEPYTRLNALRASFAIKNILAIELPVLIITPDGKRSEYSLEQQLTDVIQIKRNDQSMQELLTAFGLSFEEILAKLLKPLETNLHLINLSQSTKNIALLGAFKTKNKVLVSALLEAGADPNHFESPVHDLRPLSMAIFNNWQDITQMLLNKKLSPETVQQAILLILSELDDTRDPLLSEILVQFNTIDLNSWRFPDTENRALHLAIIKNKSIEIISLLLKNGADFTKKNKQQKSPLDLAMDMGRIDVVEAILNMPKMPSSSIDDQVNGVITFLINQKRQDLARTLVHYFPKQVGLQHKNTLLQHAIQEKLSGPAIALLDQDAEADYLISNVEGNLLWQAVKNDLMDVADHMLKKALKPDALGMVLLDILYEDHDRHLPFAKKILENPNPILLNYWYFETHGNALQMALIRKKPLAIIELLCSRGVDANYDKKGKLALLLATESAQYEAALSIIDNHTDATNFTTPQLTELINAFLEKKKSDLAFALCRRYSEKVEQSLKNRLLLDAIQSKETERAQALLNLGASPNHFENDNLKYTAFILAIQQGLTEVVNQMLHMNLSCETLQQAILLILHNNKPEQFPILTQILNQYSLDLNAMYISNTENRALHLAILNHMPLPIISLLCRRGANIHQTNNKQKTPLDMAIESRQLDLVRTLIQISNQPLNQAQFLAAKELTLACKDTFFILDLYKPANIPCTTTNKALNWEQFEYFIKGIKDPSLMPHCIEQHLDLMGNIDDELKTLIKKHALSCCNYVMDNNKGWWHGRDGRQDAMRFLKRILFDNIPTSEALLLGEATHYMKGSHEYSHWFSHGTSYREHSRIAYAHDLGLFHSNIQKDRRRFKELTTDERIQFVSRVKQGS